MSTVRDRTRYVVQLGLLMAILLVFAFTPLGYLKTPVVEITFLFLPVAIGAVLLGSTASATLGFAVGLTSFYQAFLSPGGQMFLNENMVLTFIWLVGSRVLAGWLAGLLYTGLSRLLHKRDHPVAIVATTFAAPALNTLLYLGMMFLLFSFSKNQELLALIKIIASVSAVFNGSIEAAAGVLIGTPVCIGLLRLQRTIRR